MVSHPGSIGNTYEEDCWLDSCPEDGHRHPLKSQTVIAEEVNPYTFQKPDIYDKNIHFWLV